jgi:hypothetical protein
LRIHLLVPPGLARIFHGSNRCSNRPRSIDCGVGASPPVMRAKSAIALSELAERTEEEMSDMAERDLPMCLGGHRPPLQNTS